jgi:hypothetical protein
MAASARTTFWNASGLPPATCRPSASILAHHGCLAAMAALLLAIGEKRQAAALHGLGRSLRYSTPTRAARS